MLLRSFRLAFLALAVGSTPRAEEAAAAAPAASDAAREAAARRWQEAIPEALRPLPAAVPDERNAYVLWRDGGPAVEPPDVPETPDGESLCPEDAPFPGGAAGDALRSWLGRCEPLLALIDEGLRRGEYRPRLELASEARFHCLRTISQALDALGLRVKLAASEGRLDDAVSDVELMARLGGFLESGFLIDLNFAHAARRSAEDAARWLSASRGLTETAYERLIATCYEPLERNAFAAILRQEYLLYAVPAIGELAEEASGPGLARTIRALVDDDLTGDLRGQRMAVAAILEGHPRPLDRAETLRLLGDKVLALMERARGPWRAQLEPFVDAETVVAAAALWPIELRGSGKRSTPAAGAVARARRALLGIPNPLGRLVVSDHLRDETAFFGLGYASFARIWFQTSARRELTLAVLGLRRDEQRRGAATADLEGVVARGALSRPPVDPYDGTRIRYDAARRIVWACGPDGDDDGGRPPAEDDDTEDGDEVLSTRWEERR